MWTFVGWYRNIMRLWKVSMSVVFMALHFECAWLRRRQCATNHRTTNKQPKNNQKRMMKLSKNLCETETHWAIMAKPIRVCMLGKVQTVWVHGIQCKKGQHFQTCFLRCRFAFASANSHSGNIFAQQTKINNNSINTTVAIAFNRRENSKAARTHTHTSIFNKDDDEEISAATIKSTSHEMRNELVKTSEKIERITTIRYKTGESEGVVKRAKIERMHTMYECVCVCMCATNTYTFP